MSHELEETQMTFCLKCGNKAALKIPEGDNRKRIVCDHCGYIHYQNPNIICGAVVVHEDKVLLCKRAIEPQYGLWTIPAGFMEIGETVEQGAKRETLEEAEATATNLKLYCIYDIPIIGQVYMLYLTNLQDGNFGAGSESLECQLFTEDEIPWDEMAFDSSIRSLRHYFADRQTYSNFVDFPLHHETISTDFIK